MASGSTDDEVDGGADAGRSDRIELFAVILMSLTAILTAWSGFQSAKWSGVQAIAFSEAAALRTESVRSSNLAVQLASVDVAFFSNYIDASAQGNDDLAQFYRERFPDRLEAATQVWVQADPIENPDAAPTPFALPEYQLDEAVDAAELEVEATQRASDARAANQRSDNYVLMTVLFAAVLFFAALSGRLTSRRASMIALSAATAGFLVCATVVVTFPVEI